MISLEQELHFMNHHQELVRDTHFTLCEPGLNLGECSLFRLEFFSLPYCMHEVPNTLGLMSNTTTLQKGDASCKCDLRRKGRPMKDLSLSSTYRADSGPRVKWEFEGGKLP